MARLRVLYTPDSKMILIYDQMPELNERQAAMWHRFREQVLAQSDVVAVLHFEFEVDIECAGECPAPTGGKE